MLKIENLSLDMSQEGWEAIAKELVATPGAVDEIIALAQQTPYFHLAGYMNRWWYLPENPNPAPGRICGARVHNILRRDNDRHMHDHPWHFRTIILKGWYREELLHPDGTITSHLHVAGDTVYRGQGYYHQIVEVSPEPLFTLCLLGRRNERSWGFLKDGQHVHHEQYLDGFATA